MIPINVKSLALVFYSRYLRLLSGIFVSFILSSTMPEASYAVSEVSDDALVISHSKQRVVNPQGPIREPFRREVDLSVEPVLFPSLNILVGVEARTGRPLVVGVHPDYPRCSESAVGDLILSVMDGMTPWTGVGPNTRIYQTRTLDELRSAVETYSFGDEVTVAFFRGPREQESSVRFVTRRLSINPLCERYWELNP